MVGLQSFTKNLLASALFNRLVHTFKKSLTGGQMGKKRMLFWLTLARATDAIAAFNSF